MVGRSVGQTTNGNNNRVLLCVTEYTDISWSVSSSVGRSVCRSVGRSIPRPVGPSACWSVGRSVRRSVGRSVGRSVVSQVVYSRAKYGVIYQHKLEQIKPPKSLQNHFFPSGNRFGMEKEGVTAFFVSHELFLYISNLILTVFDFAWV